MLETNMLILVTDEMILFLDDHMNQLGFTKPSDINPCITYVTCFTQALNQGFLLACQASPKEDSYAFCYQGSNRPNRSSWLMRCNINLAARKVNIDNHNAASILFQSENVHSVLEYAPNQMIVHVSPTELLTVIDWKVVNVLQDSAPGNN